MAALLTCGCDAADKNSKPQAITHRHDCKPILCYINFLGLCDKLLKLEFRKSWFVDVLWGSKQEANWTVTICSLHRTKTPPETDGVRNRQ